MPLPVWLMDPVLSPRMKASFRASSSVGATPPVKTSTGLGPSATPYKQGQVSVVASSNLSLATFASLILYHAVQPAAERKYQSERAHPMLTS